MNTSFDRISDGKDEWLTPPELIMSLGEFDLDPCAPIKRPWPTAKKHYTIEDDGLRQEWTGRVFMNPPYGNQTGIWLAKMSIHNNGIVLIFARTETDNFFRYVWPIAKGIMFVKGRIAFYNVDGTKPKNTAGAPSCLIAYGEDNANMLRNSKINGKYLEIR